MPHTGKPDFSNVTQWQDIKNIYWAVCTHEQEEGYRGNALRLTPQNIVPLHEAKFDPLPPIEKNLTVLCLPPSWYIKKWERVSTFLLLEGKNKNASWGRKIFFLPLPYSYTLSFKSSPPALPASFFIVAIPEGIFFAPLLKFSRCPWVTVWYARGWKILTSLGCQKLSTYNKKISLNRAKNMLFVRTKTMYVQCPI